MPEYCYRYRKFFVLAFVVFCCSLMMAGPGWGQPQARITRVGLSRVKDTTLITVVTTRNLNPQITPVLEAANPRLLIDFPGAQGEHMPPLMAGDGQLVKEVRVESIPGKPGVRLLLDMMPGRNYTYWRRINPGPGSTVYFIVGLKEDTVAGGPPSPGLPLGEREDLAAARPAPRSSTAPPPVPQRGWDTETRSRPRVETGRLETGPYQQIGQLMPGLTPALSYFERSGWQVENQGTTDKNGKNHYLLTHGQYPEMAVRLVHVPGRGGSPAINSVTLTTDRLSGSEADRYRKMRTWSMGEIRRHYEDIGDYYDDGLKPLRIILRERTKAVALRHFDVFRQFLEAAVPQDPQLPDTVLKYIQEKVNKRLEGAQYTVSQDPLAILTMVDFLYVRVYSIGR